MFQQKKKETINEINKLFNASSLVDKFDFTKFWSNKSTNTKKTKMIKNDTAVKYDMAHPASFPHF